MSHFVMIANDNMNANFGVIVLFTEYVIFFNSFNRYIIFDLLIIAQWQYWSSIGRKNRTLYQTIDKLLTSVLIRNACYCISNFYLESKMLIAYCMTDDTINNNGCSNENCFNQKPFSKHEIATQISVCNTNFVYSIFRETSTQYKYAAR